MAHFTVMSYNVGNGLARPDRLADALGRCGADIIGLQELTVSQAEAISAKLADDYPYQSLHGAGIPGKGVLSRFPIRIAMLMEVHPNRPDLLALLDVEQRELQLIVAHPPPPRPYFRGMRHAPVRHTPDARRQFDRFVELTEAGHTTILLGDFNMRDSHEEYDILISAGLQDAFRGANQHHLRTYPLRRGRVPLRPVFRLDYIWHSPNLHVTHARVGEDAGSDHLPVIAEMSW
ncbi:MAG: endonuclease/exonuclease/phosphatase family protein [Anaerolineae bacterium]